MYSSGDVSSSGFLVAILNLRRRLTADIFLNDANDFLDPENMWLTVGILSLSCIEAEIEGAPEALSGTNVTIFHPAAED